ncbi:MAG: hypothetical protein ACK529_03075, partial [Alphaproteobacteria bacterium]
MIRIFGISGTTRQVKTAEGTGCGRIWAVAVLLALTFGATPAQAARIKDVVAFEGIRDNVLMGYG